MKTKFKTTATFVSGAVCGEIWWPVGALCGRPVKFDLRGYDGFGCFADPAGATFDDVLEHYLRCNGGDFQNAKFSEDSEIVIERRMVEAPGRYTMHIRRIPVSVVAPSLVRAGAFAADFFGE